MSQFPEHIEAALKHIAQNENVQNPKFINQIPNSKGDGYMGTFYILQIKGDNKTLEIVAKGASDNVEIRKHVPLTTCCKTETVVYGKLLPLFEALQKGKKLEKPFSLPKSYWISDKELKELIILENLKIQGFENWDRLKAFDQSHTEIAMKEYSRLHAAGFALKKENPKEFEEVAVQLGNNMYLWWTMAKMVDTIEVLCNRILTYFNPKLDQDIIAAWKKVTSGFKQYLFKYDRKTDPFAVPNHGDCWSNNMLFKYQVVNGKKELVDMVLLDFQLCYVTSFVHDIAFYLTTCCDKNVFENIDHYLDVYYDSLISQLRNLGHNPNTIITKSQFLKEFESKAAYALVMSIFFIRINLIESEEAPDISEAISGNFVKRWGEDIKNEAIFKERAEYFVRFYYKKKYLDVI